MHVPVKEIIAENPNTRVLVYMRPVLGPDSERLARFALAADIQGKFKIVHDELYTVQYKTDDAAFVELSKKTGVNWSKAKADMNGPAVNERLAKNIAIAEKIQVNGTPFFVTPSSVIPGATDKANLLR
jgi:protein-disulfide isomerase